MRCTLCPRRCSADREAGEIGFCGAGDGIRVAKTMLHMWEEPCLGEKSGAIFFAGCPLRCVYCQNKPISQGEIAGEMWDEDRLAAEMLAFVRAGADNIDLVSPTQYADGIFRALSLVKDRLSVPVVWNTGGYETAETVEKTRGLVDIFLTDMKYGTAALADRYSAAPDYPEIAVRALAAMVRTVGEPKWNGDRLSSGVVMRHLVLPGGRHDSIKALTRAAEAVDPGSVVLSLMRQYTPDFAPPEIKELRRRVTTFEYESVRDAALALGYDGFSQDADSAEARFTPEF